MTEPFSVAVQIGAVFVVGEVLAVLSLAFRWFYVWTFVPVLASMVLLIAAAVIIPIVRSVKDTEDA